MKTNWYKNFSILTLFLISSTFLSADPTNFVKKTAGAGYVIDAIRTTDGGYVSLSELWNGTPSFIVRKTTSSGTQLWGKLLEIEIGRNEALYLQKIVQTTNGYILVGERAYGGYYGYLTGIVVALGLNGNLLWKRGYGITHGNVFFTSAVAMPDGFIAVGSDFHSLVVVKLNGAGSILWSKTVPSAAWNVQYPQAKLTSDNGLVIADSRNRQAIYVVRMDHAGTVVWTKKLKLQQFDLQSFSVTSGNSVVLAGRSAPNQLVILRLDATGMLQDKAQYALTAPNFFISDVEEGPDQELVLAGGTYRNSGGGDQALFLKIDQNANIVFNTLIGTSGVSEEANSIFITPQQEYILFGSSGSDPSRIGTDTLFLSLNSEGSVPGCASFHTFTSKRAEVPDVIGGSFQLQNSQPLLFNPADYSVKVSGFSGKASILCK